MQSVLLGLVLILLSPESSTTTKETARENSDNSAQDESNLVNFDVERGDIEDALLPSAALRHCLLRESRPTPVSLFVSVFSRRSNIRERETIRKSWMGKLRKPNILTEPVTSQQRRVDSTKLSFTVRDTCVLFVVAKESCAVPPWARAHPNECRPNDGHMDPGKPSPIELAFWNEQMRNETQILRAEAERLQWKMIAW